MSPSPVTEQDQEGVKHYRASWQALMQQVRSGSSWSGYERNCCFLNTGGQFASASHVSGLDHADDGRGLAVTDWDQDGDLDLWFRNRTAPRLRLMLNQAADQGSRRFVAFRLRGTKVNRDAIGAVVELQLEGSDPRLVRSLRAGELFLSQSSKWVHFGLPEDATVKSVKVLWPGGLRSTYDQLEAGKRFLLKEGETSARPLPSTRQVTLESAPLKTVHRSTGQASIVLPAPVPLPNTSYLDESGKAVTLTIAKKARLLILWSAGCPHCKRELAGLARHSTELEIVALCVDGHTIEARSSAKTLLAEIGFSGTWGMIGAEALERVHVLQEALFDLTPEFAVPFSLLLKPGNEIVAIYRGALSSEVLAHDLRVVVTATGDALRNLAPPFSGRWFTKPAGPAFLPNLIARRIQARYPEEALPYLQHAAEKSGEVEKERLMAELGRRHFQLADKYAKQRLSAKSDYHYLKSLEAAPDNPSVHNDYGTSLAQRGLLHDGARHFAEALRLRPNFPLAKKNLARAQELLKQSGQ
ncbi:MAG: ASPIC/UnbV domain-containing protein [Akkermansiaceae bacterium]